MIPRVRWEVDPHSQLGRSIVWVISRKPWLIGGSSWLLTTGWNGILKMNYNSLYRQVMWLSWKIEFPKKEISFLGWKYFLFGMAKFFFFEWQIFFVWITKFPFLDNKILFLDNKILFLDNKILFLDNKILFLDNKILFLDIINFIA